MEKILIYVALGLGIVFLILLVMAMMGKGEKMPKWLGPVGGIMVAIVAVFGISKASGGGDLAKIRAENDRLEKELERLAAKRKEIDAQYEKEKQEYEAQLKTLQEKLEASETERKDLESRLASTAGKTPMEWFNSLPADEKTKIKNEIDKGITWL
jgi:cell shape-determining protein MreC